MSRSLNPGVELGFEPGVEPPVLRRAKGCAECSYSGYRGRSGVFELVVVDEHLRSMIHDGASEQDRERHARKRTPGMHSDGLRRVLAGETSLEELMRVIQEK